MAKSNAQGVWPVSYHGTKVNFVEPILKEGLKPGHRDACHFGQEYSIYSTDDIQEAEKYAAPFNTSEGTFKYIFQNRINTPVCKKEPKIGYCYFGSTIHDIRPYGLLVKKTGINTYFKIANIPENLRTLL